MTRNFSGLIFFGIIALSTIALASPVSNKHSGVFPTNNLTRMGNASFGNGLPVGLASDSAGNVYVADFFKNRILKIKRDNTTIVLAGTGELGYRNGHANIAQFSGPSAVAVDAKGNVIVADSGNDLIRKIDPSGVVTTIAGDYQWYADSNMRDRDGARDGVGTQARFHYPQGVAVDSFGNIFVADSQNQRIRMITQGGVVTTLSGKSNWTRIGYKDGTASEAIFNYPEGLSWGRDGTLYVADNNAVRKIAPDGSVSTLSGGRRARLAASENDAFKYTGGHVDGAAQIAEFASPVALAVDGSGYVYVADENNMAIRRVAPDGNAVTLVDLTNHYPPPTNPPTARPGAPIGIALLPDGALAICVPDGIFKYTIAEHRSPQH